ncbi:hypothetical protein M422DRAFT_41085 [Sphaerobolus stellatus SS14]|nr:hypothetical protein M422DRAFT_41085 [Sphaerobolus stellatus SS14]
MSLLSRLTGNPPLRLRFTLCIIWLMQYYAAFAALVNVTVDDAASPIIYTPFGPLWNQGNGCIRCSTRPDPQSMFDDTWHDGTYNPLGPSGAPGSTGTAIYAFCALFDFANMTFFVDGQIMGHWSTEQGGNFSYQVPVFAHSGLSSGPHTFTLMNGVTDGSGSQSLVLFDYLIYTHDDGTSQSSQPASAAISPQFVQSPGPTQPQSPGISTTAVTTVTETSIITTTLGSNTTLSNGSSILGKLNTKPEVTGSFTGTGSLTGSLAGTLVQTTVGASSTNPGARLLSQTALASSDTGLGKIKGVIIGGIAAAIALFIILLVVGIFLWRRRSNLKASTGDNKPTNHVEQFISSADGLVARQGSEKRDHGYTGPWVYWYGGSPESNCRSRESNCRSRESNCGSLFKD